METKGSLSWLNEYSMNNNQQGFYVVAEVGAMNFMNKKLAAAVGWMRVNIISLRKQTEFPFKH